MKNSKLYESLQYKTMHNIQNYAAMYRVTQYKVNIFHHTILTKVSDIK